MNNKINVVEFFCEPLNYGGQEAFIKNVYFQINKDKFHFKFITPFECQNKELKKIISNNNDEIIYENSTFDSIDRKKSIIQTAKKELSSEINVVHIHSGSIFALYNVAKIAKQKGIKKVIVHSHATGKNNLKYKLIKILSDANIEKYADLFFSCSYLAGKWKYPEKVLNSNKFYIIRNGIDLDKYAFNAEKRKEYQDLFKLNDYHVIIHVGRFTVEKNQLFIIDFFNEMRKTDKKIKLFLVGGDGETLDQIKEKINSLNLDECVLVLQNRDDINNLLSMSDVFVLPSLWEGLPFTGIEAQANGIPCIFSDTITDELNMTESFHKLPLGNTIEWAKKIFELFKEKRKNNYESLKKSGYDIKETCLFLEKIYSNEKID